MSPSGTKCIETSVLRQPIRNEHHPHTPANLHRTTTIVRLLSRRLIGGRLFPRWRRLGRFLVWRFFRLWFPNRCAFSHQLGPFESKRKYSRPQFHREGRTHSRLGYCVSSAISRSYRQLKRPAHECLTSCLSQQSLRQFFDLMINIPIT